MIQGIRKNFHEISLEAGHLVNGRYPDFVRLRQPPPLTNGIPVFMFHSIKPDVFEAQMRFLASNGYQTITCDEFYEMITQHRPIPPKTVLLTIDDGKSSVWVHAYPLLKKYNFKATIFLIPGYIQESADYDYNLEDYWNKRCQPGQVRSRDNDFNPLLTWQQIREMRSSGLIDFQCHTLFHHKVFTGPDIIDFFNPSHREPIFNVVVPIDYEDRLISGNHEDLYGMPIHSNQPLMAAQPRYFNDVGCTDSCIEYVANNGGIKFFTKSTWRQELRGFISRDGTGFNHRYQSQQETQKEIFDNLVAARKLIEENVPGQAVRHLCYPFGIGSKEAVKCSMDAGYVSNFWVTHPSKAINRAGDDPFYCCRLKDDYIFRLPGTGRKSLLEILLQKLKRRVTAESIY